MKIYLATPVNARKEKTMHEKLKCALKRIQEMAKYIVEQKCVVEQVDDEIEFSSSFEIPSIRTYLSHPEFGYAMTEAIVMGRCVTMVMEADMIVLDDGWECSQGCTVERFVAMQYGKQVKTINSFKLNEVLKGCYKLAEKEMNKIK